MKTRILILTILSSFLTGSVFAQTPANASTYYRQGVNAEQAGDPDAAREAYQQALRLNPQHADARFRLGQLGMRREAIVRQGRQAALTGVTLPNVVFDDANLRESLDALATMVETQSEGKVAPNFVVQDPDGTLAEARISLKLRNVTAGAVLDYIVEMAKARARHDEFAIVIMPE